MNLYAHRRCHHAMLTDYNRVEISLNLVWIVYPESTIRVWADRNAVDSPAARARYGHPFYGANQRLTGIGYNLPNLGGI